RINDPYNFSVVADAGDVNGDGFSDLIIGDGNDSVAYVVFGKASGFSYTLDYSNLNGSNGFKFFGFVEYTGTTLAIVDYTGATVASAGDVNGDGFADLVIGAPGHSANGRYQAGAAYVVFGKASGFPAGLDASSL